MSVSRPALAAFCAAWFCVAGAACASVPPDAPVEWRDDDLAYALANLQFAVAHELGHVLIEELDIPVLGGVEYAADQLAALAFLEGLPGHPHDLAERRRYGKTLTAVAAQWRVEWALARLEKAEIAYWDEHPLDIQRFYNIACFLYGSDPEYYDSFVESVGLPPERARACEARFPAARSAALWVTRTYGSRDSNAGSALSLVYEPGRDPVHRKLESVLRGTGVLEEIVELVGPRFELPRAITVVIANCLGQADAAWRDDLAEVVICYELVLRFLEHSALNRCMHRLPGAGGASEPDITAAVARCLAAGRGGGTDAKRAKPGADR